MPTEPTQQSNVPYFLIVGGMAVVGVVAIVLVSVLRPDADNSALITTIIGLLLPTTASILALLKTQETQVTMNARFDAILEEKPVVSAQTGMPGRTNTRVINLKSPFSPRIKGESDSGTSNNY